MKEKYELGLALSGGGAKGAAHCGALQAMSEFDIKPDYIAGTSVGSIVGALYAAGITPVEMINLFVSKDFKDLLNVTVPKEGFFEQSPLIEYLQKCIPAKTFADLKIPMMAVACDLDHGCIKIFDEGELAPRIMASCSIPVFFFPTKIDGVNYVDGGVFKNFPVECIRKKCKKIIGVNVSPLDTSKYKHNILNVALRTFFFMFKSNTFVDEKKCDILVKIDTTEYGVFNLSNIKELFEVGYNETVIALEAAGYKRIYEKQKLNFKKTTKAKKNEIIHEKVKEYIGEAENFVQEMNRKIIKKK